MNPNISPLKSRLLEALKEISDQSALDDAKEDAEIASATNIAVDVADNDAELDHELAPVLSLRALPVLEWEFITLSQKSKFGDALWDFSEYPHVAKRQVRINWVYTSKDGINLAHPRCKHWARIIKALSFYSIPHFSVSSYVRSYGSLASKNSKLRKLLGLFKKYNLYMGEFGQPGFRTINDLSSATIDEFIKSLDTSSKRWETAHAIQFWQRLSLGNLLPEEYSIWEQLITKKEVGRLRKEFDDKAQPYAPIELDDYANIIDHCVKMVENYSADVLWLYDTYYPTIVGGFEYPERGNLKVGGVSSGSEEGVNAFLKYQPVSYNGAPWWSIRVKERTSEHKKHDKPWGYIDVADIISVTASLIDACCVIILATTGMRRSEVINLRSGCVTQDDEGHWLRYTVFKTSRASQGDNKRIPIPQITADAIAIMERLGREARMFGKTDRLFASINKGHFGRPTHAAYPERAVKRVSLAVDADESIHPHRYRKTLAMYLVYQDPRNIEIVRQLFSHASLKMTLRYVMSLPGIDDEIKKIIVQQNVDILVEVLNAALTGRIGGKAGKRLQKAVEDKPQFAARLQDKGKETLVQYIDSMLDQGIKILHRTNLAICLKTPGYLESAPCDAKNDDPATKLHPNLFACDPFNCRFAAFVESNTPAMRSEILFHDKLIRHTYASDRQKKFSERRIAEVTKRLVEIGHVGTYELLQEVSNG
ncbi:site-specific integrase [Massilia sp. Root335]|uniref:tyrosine-type recombinase/integrase n=1 Tax=Massilia sp. Root335 TaxID=1736517 RepID=UPI0009E8FC6D|nr:site-specific integrase [Massilia sp. Root335]